jgi:hypothetical protein
MRRLILVIGVLWGLFMSACGAPAGQDTPQTASNDTPRMDATCTKADERTTIDGTEAICMVDSAGMLAWQRADAPSGDQARIDGPCNTADERANIDGVEVICMLNSAGNLAWQSAKPGDSGSGSNQVSDNGNTMVQVGMTCDAPGDTVFMNELYVCKNGIWGYPIPGDLPINADGSKPDWYPDLDTLVNHGQAPATCTPSEVTFTHSFLPVDQLDASIPHGAMIGDHVTPIDHAYIGIKTLNIAAEARTDADYLPITAPADGTIVDVGSLGSPTSHRVVINHGCGVYTIYMVVNRLTGALAEVAATVESQGNVSTNIPIKAGEEFGQQRDNPLDFNVWAADSWLSGLANPLSYIYAESWKPYTADPTRFFTPELAEQYSNIMQRTSEPRWGKIDHDVVGSASGNWFLQGTMGYSGRAVSDYANATEPVRGGQVPGKNTYAYGHLSISPHEVAPQAWVFSTGWWQDPAGDPRQTFLVIGADQPTPDQLTSADGVVVYGLADGQRLDADGAPIQMDPARSMAPMPIGYTIGVGPAFGSVALQVNADGTLSVELFPDQPNVQITQLSEQQRIYQR